MRATMPAQIAYTHGMLVLLAVAITPVVAHQAYHWNYIPWWVSLSLWSEWLAVDGGGSGKSLNYSSNCNNSSWDGVLAVVGVAVVAVVALRQDGLSWNRGHRHHPLLPLLPLPLLFFRQFWLLSSLLFVLFMMSLLLWLSSLLPFVLLLPSQKNSILVILRVMLVLPSRPLPMLPLLPLLPSLSILPPLPCYGYYLYQGRAYHHHYCHNQDN